MISYETDKAMQSIKLFNKDESISSTAHQDHQYSTVSVIPNVKSDILVDAWSHRTTFHNFVAKDVSPKLKTEDSKIIGKYL